MHQDRHSMHRSDLYQHESMLEMASSQKTALDPLLQPRERDERERMGRTWERSLLLPRVGEIEAAGWQDVGGREKGLSQMSREEKVLWLCFFVLGAGTLAGWNSLCAAVDFFRVHFEGRDAPVWLSLTFEVATMASLCLLALGADKLSGQTRFGVGFLTGAAVLAAIPIATDQLGAAAWIVVVCLSAGLGMGNGMTEGSLYGLAAAASESAGVQYAVPAQAGQGFVGVFVCGCRVATKAMFPQDKKGSMLSAQVFFSLAALLSFVCALVGRWVASVVRGSRKGEGTVAIHHLDWQEKSGVVREIRDFAQANVMVNCVSMMLFPALATSAQATTTEGLSVSWMDVVVVSCYSITDTVGNLCGMDCLRLLSGGRRPVATELQTSSVWRVVLVPMLLLSSTGRVKSDLYVVAVTSLLGFTNGALSVACMSIAPDAIKEGESAEIVQSRKEYGGYIMTVALLVGVTLGLTLAVPLNLVADSLRL